jgi:hypothetical protein
VNQPDVPRQLVSWGAKASRSEKIRFEIKEFVILGLAVAGDALVLVMKYQD